MAILDLNEADVVEAAKKQPQETTLAAECTSRHLRTAEQALVNVSMDQGVEISQDVRLSTVMRKATESVKHNCPRLDQQNEDFTAIWHT